MTVTCIIYIEKRWFPAPKDFDWLKKDFPESVRFVDTGKCFFFSKEFENPTNNPAYLALAEHLKRTGMKPMPKIFYAERDVHPERLVGHFCTDTVRTFGPQECAKSEYSSFWPSFDVKVGCRTDSNGELFVEMGDLYNEGDEKVQSLFPAGKLPIFEIEDGNLAVSSRTKQLLEDSGLRGFSITRRLPVGGRCAEDVKGVYWHLDLPVVVPESNQTRWLSPDGTVYAGGWVPGAVLAADGYHTFDRSVLKAAGFPDLVRRELHVDPRIPTRRIHFNLGSRRFFEFCKANKLKCEWEPVKIVD